MEKQGINKEDRGAKRWKTLDFPNGSECWTICGREKVRVGKPKRIQTGSCIFKFY